MRLIGSAAIGAGIGLAPQALADAPGEPGGALRVLLVNGSPHENGCTRTALAEVGASLAQNGVESEFFWIGRKPLSGCMGCGGCARTGRCVFDDRVNEFLDAARPYDGFVLGSPVHFSGVAGAMSAFLNRAFFCDRATNQFCLKPGAAVVTCRRSGSTTALDQLNKYLIHRGMPIVPSQYWPMAFGNTPDEIRQDREGMQIMRTLGQNMAWMLKSFDAARRAGIARPVYEPRVGTNFIR